MSTVTAIALGSARRVVAGVHIAARVDGGGVVAAVGVKV